MKKIPNLFKRDWSGDRSRVLPELNPDADVAWVFTEGIATVKWDGSACLVRDGVLYVRFDAKRGKTPPAGFEPCQEADPVTGHRPGWIPAAGNPAAKWHVDAFMNVGGVVLEDGTYEACGPQHQGNPYSFPRNILIKHGVHCLTCSFTEFPADWWLAHPEYVREQHYVWFHINGWHHPEMPAPMPIEGIVWHHPDGRMVKVLASDLGVPWKAKTRA